MVYCVCSNCNSDDMKLENDKYLVCNECGSREYVRDIEIDLVNEEENIINIDKLWTVENCFKMYELTKLLKSKCGYKYSMTRDGEYNNLREEAIRLMLIMEKKCLSEINLEEIHSKVCSLYIRMRKLNEREV